MNHLKQLFKRPLQTLLSVDAYELWSQSYAAEAHNPLMAAEQEGMLALMPSLDNKIVLDLACGTGRYGKIAQENGAKQVLAFDNSLHMLQANAIDHIALASSEAIPLPSESVDIVLCGLALGHLPTIEPSLSEISRVLKQDGIALISDFHPYQCLKGAQRTFTAADGTVFAVEHYLHHISDYFQVGAKVGLQITALNEPKLFNDEPVVLIMRYQKMN